MAKKILLTGSSGFVGGALCRELLASGQNVKALVRRLPKEEPRENLEYVIGDLRDPSALVEAVKNVDIVIHVAGVVSARTEAEYLAGNAIGTQNLIQAIKENNPNLERFVLISSLAAAGPSTPARPREEKDQNQPVSAYGRSKLAGEKALLQSGLPGVIIRPPAVYGPRDKGVYEFFKVVAAGWHPLLGGGKNRRYSFVHVDDLVNGIMAAAFMPTGSEYIGLSPQAAAKEFEQDSTPSVEIFYICGDEILGWNQTMELLASALKVKVKKVPLPVAALAIAAIGGSTWSKISRKETKLNWDKFQELKAPSWTCNNDKAKRLLGYEPKWKLADGFKQTADWYREQGWL